MASASDSLEEVPQIPYSELIIKDIKESILGDGGFGVAYLAKHARLGTVVYKELHAQKLGDRIYHELEKEARMRFLRHGNIVAFLAVIFETGHYGVVMEYVPLGSLDDFTFKYDVDWPWKLSFAHDIVRGMKYLHSLQPPVIHSDLKPENVLISDTFVAKICDFGLAKWTQLAATQTDTGKRRGTVAYMAPEVHKDPRVSRTTAYDVYAFGIVVWELLSEEKPFKDVSIERVEALVKRGDRPALNSVKGNAALVSFAKKWIPRCWHKSANKRPTFDDLQRRFADIRQIEAAKPVSRPFLRQPKLAWTQAELAWTTESFDYEVSGVTVLDNIMYVVCGKSSTIRLYNTDTHSPLDVVINVDGMEDPRDIAVCRDDRQLYVADLNDRIWRVSVSDRSYVKWLSTESTTDTFYVDKLSVTSRRLLVTSSPLWQSRRLRQYSTTDRQLLRVVELPQYMWPVFHGVETTRGTFVVGHYGTSQDAWQFAVSEVDVTGRLLRTFTDVTPLHLSLDSEGRVMVADYDNHRILLLNNELQLQHVLIDRNSQVKLWRPRRLCYDELTSRLYVVHHSRDDQRPWPEPDVISSFHLR